MDMIEKLIKYEESQVGYLEKASNKDLDPKVGSNVGDRNYTKYSQDLIEKIGKPFMNGVSWCVIFQMDSFVRVFGVEQAKKLLHVWTMSCTELIRHFKDPDEVPENPKAGDMLVDGHRKIKLCYGNDDDSTTKEFNSTGDGYVDIGCTPSGTSGGYISKMKYTSNGMFSSVSSGTASTYYCSGQWYNNSGTMYALRGGCSCDGALVGAFCVSLSDAFGYAGWDIGASPSYK